MLPKSCQLFSSSSSKFCMICFRSDRNPNQHINQLNSFFEACKRKGRKITNQQKMGNHTYICVCVWYGWIGSAQNFFRFKRKQLKYVKETLDVKSIRGFLCSLCCPDPKKGESKEYGALVVWSQRFLLKIIAHNRSTTPKLGMDVFLLF